MDRGIDGSGVDEHCPACGLGISAGDDRREIEGVAFHAPCVERPMRDGRTGVGGRLRLHRGDAAGAWARGSVGT